MNAKIFSTVGANLGILLTACYPAKEALTEKVSSPSPSQSIQKTANPAKKISLEKDQSGRWVVGWKVFQDYDSSKKQLGVHLKRIIDQEVAIKGFMIPLDYSGKKVKEFLLVPYIPSCMHIPPPPVNMIVNVSLSEKSDMKSSYYPVEVVGTLRLGEKVSKISDPLIPNGIFSMKATSIKEVKR